MSVFRATTMPSQPRPLPSCHRDSLVVLIIVMMSSTYLLKTLTHLQPQTHMGQMVACYSLCHNGFV